ncbi:MAG: hypothetical protein QXM46_05400 [Candidatus Hadarchaeales archaeon]
MGKARKGGKEMHPIFTEVKNFYRFQKRELFFRTDGKIRVLFGPKVDWGEILGGTYCWG